MGILDQQIAELVVDVRDDMVNGQAGTDNTLFDKTQTGLQSAVGATDIALIDKTNTDNVISVNHFLDTSTGNGNTYTEFEVNDGAGTSYNRAVKAGVVKTSTLEQSAFHNFEVIIVL